MGTYTNRDEVAALAAITTPSGSLLSKERYDLFIDLAEHELNGIARMQYVLPLSETGNPVGYAIMKAAAQVGALFYGFVLVQQQSADLLDNPWQAPWERILTRLSSDRAFPDGLLVSEGAVEAQGVEQVREWITAAVEEAFRASGDLTPNEVENIIARLVEPWTIRDNVELPEARDIVDTDGKSVGDHVVLASDGGLELVDPPSGGGGGGLTQAQVDARVRAVEGPDPATWAEDGNTDQIPANKLGNAPSGGLDQAAVDARVAAGVADWAEQGDTSQIPANKLSNAPTGGSGGGLTNTQVNALIDGRVEDWAETGNTDDVPDDKLPDRLSKAQQDMLQDDAAALRYTQSLGSATTTTATSDTGQATTIDVPANEASARLRIAIGTLDETFPLSELHAKPAINISDQLSSSNALVLTDTDANENYYVARLGTGKLLLGRESIGTTTASFSLIRPDLEDWARRSSTEAIPADKLTNAPAGGLDQAAVDARVAAGVEDWAEEGNTEAIPAGKLTNAPSGGLNNAQVDARITRHPDVVTLRDEAEDLRHEETVFDGTVNNPIGGLYYALPSPNPDIPAVVTGRRQTLRFSFGSGIEDTLELSAFLRTDAVGAGNNITSLILRQTSRFYRITSGSRNYFVGRTTEGKFVVGTSGGPSINRFPFQVFVEEVDLAEWARTSNDDAIPAAKLTNASGLDQAAVDARVNALVNAIALVGNTARWGWDKLVAGLQSFYTTLNPYIRQLEALGKDVDTAGWRQSTGVTVAPLEMTDRTLSWLRARPYSAQLPEVSPAIGSPRWLFMRTERSVLGGRPDATDLRFRIGDDNNQAVMSYKGASADSPVTYDYWSLRLGNVPEGAIIWGEWYGPTEFGDNIRMPAGAIQGDLPASQVSGIPSAGIIELQDGTLSAPAITNYNATHKGVRAQFTTAFDGDDHSHGIIEASLRLNVVGATVPAGTVGFEEIPLRTTATADQLTVNKSGFVSISDILALDVWSNGASGQELTGVEIALYEGTNVIGNYQLVYSRDANNNIYRQLNYVGGSTGTTGNATIGAHLVAFAQVTDGASGGGTGGLDQAAVDARVAAGVLDWAEEGNTDDIPEAKLPGDVLTTTEHAAVDLFNPGHSFTRTLIASGNPGTGQARLVTGLTGNAQHPDGYSNYLEIEKGTDDADYFDDLSGLLPLRFWINRGAEKHLIVTVGAVQTPTGRTGNIQLWYDTLLTPIIFQRGTIDAGSASITISTPDYGDLARKPPGVGDAGGWVQISRQTSIARNSNSSNWTDTGINLGSVTQLAARMYTIAFDMGTNGTAMLTVHGSILARFTRETSTAGSNGGAIVRWRVAGGSMNTMYVAVNAARNLMMWTSSLPASIPAVEVWHDTGGAASSGLDQAAVDGRVQAGVKDFAEQGSTTKPNAVDLAATPSAGQVLKVATGGTATEWADESSGGGGGGGLTYLGQASYTWARSASDQWRGSTLVLGTASEMAGRIYTIRHSFVGLERLDSIKQVHGSTLAAVGTVTAGATDRGNNIATIGFDNVYIGVSTTRQLMLWAPSSDAGTTRLTVWYQSAPTS